MRDAEKPASKFFIIAQTTNVPDGGNERLLNDVEACLLVMNQFKNINVKRQLVSPEERVPSRRFAGAGLSHGQLFVFGHSQHLHQVECARREKVQWF